MTDRDDEQPALAGVLRDLLQSEGWRWFHQQAETEFGPAGLAKRINVIRSQVPQGPGREFELGLQIDALYVAAEAINALIKRPKDTLDSLTRKPSARPFDTFRRTLGTPR